MSLDLEEIDSYKAWWQAGGDPKKFKWQTPDHAGTRPVGQGIADLVKRLSPDGVRRTGSAEEYAKATKRKTIRKFLRMDETGKVVGEVYLDEDGKEVDVRGMKFVPFGAQRVD